MKTLILNVLFLLSFSSFSAEINIQKVEPLNWWVGLNDPELQILVYGNEIAITTPEINYAGVNISKVEKVENPNYLFIYVTISEKTKPGKFPILFKLEDKTLLQHEYELKERKQTNKLHQGFNASDVIYLIMPDRFSNGDPNNDTVKGMHEKSNRSDPNGRHGGDLQGVINHLDYISETGFTALWLNPFLENNQAAYTYHGYAISDFYNVDPRHGTNELFAKLVNDAHNKNIKVIMDMIFNHCGSGHWFYKDLPSEDWIHQHDEFYRSNFRGPVISDPYASDIDKNKMLTGWFDKNMPDLNQKNPLLATYLIQNSIWWIEFSGLDGIRVDTQPYPYKEFMAKWSKAIMTEYPDFNIVGEAWLQEIAITAYFQKDNKFNDGYNSNMPAVTDFPLHFALAEALNEEEGWNTGMAKLYLVLAQDFVYANPKNLLIFPDNHDLTRYYELMQKDFRKYKMGLAYLLTTRGIPQIYYGTELLMEGKEEQGHGYIREDFPGGWQSDASNAFTPEGRSTEQNEAYNFLSNLLNWRKNNEIVSKGKLKHFLPEDGVYVLFRYNEDGAVMLIMNNNNDEKKTLDTKRFDEILHQYSKGTEIISGKKLTSIDTINIAAKSAMIIELSK